MSDERIKLRIDLKSGTLELDCLPDDFDNAIQKTRELAASLQFGEKGIGEGLPDSRSDSAASKSPSEPAPTVKTRERGRASGAKPSTGRPGRIGSFDPIRDLLDEDQHKAIHAFMREKAPLDQEDQVLVAAHKGEQLLKRQGFSYNELYTLLWRAGVDPLPKAIDVVIQRLIQDQKMDRGEDGYFVKFLGHSRVEKELPASARD
ncbi:MAG: hypothetical protein HXX15_02750 [Rhodopseudomonas sp.]|uniref:hypothetical protein n=1 Tax=Rhodopseudomonas sp. TaxID=1078 RepID=UPI0017B9F3C5|nr:hypothetical protein [Rhodopseudomonas sp.]NVN84984.1 hypothetical protein [Rhodopseudomonas sp.]